MRRPGLGIACAALAALLWAAGAAGCGLGPGRSAGAAMLTVTERFGTVAVGSVSVRSLPGSETVMRMLERSFHVDTRYGGGFVQSINGLSGGGQRDWFYYVNGVQAPAGAAATPLHQGDEVWWDFHDWRDAESIPAVVGEFPEPFLHGVAGRRLPTVIQCFPGAAAACRRVRAVLASAGARVAAGRSVAPALTMLVGTWPALRSATAGALIARGPQVSGVFARFVNGGTELQLLDPTGRAARTLGPGAGLIAATAGGSNIPIWVITGTDAAGVSGAAAALQTGRLRDHFALATSPAGVVPVPLEAGL